MTLRPIILQGDAGVIRAEGESHIGGSGNHRVMAVDSITQLLLPYTAYYE
jgi:hypothetical protein